MSTLALIGGLVYTLVYWVLNLVFVLELLYTIRLDRENQGFEYDSYALDWFVSCMGLLLLTIVSWNTLIVLILYFCYFLLAILI